MNPSEVQTNLEVISEQFKAERPERIKRRHLEATDFNKLAEAGYLYTGVPESHGGLWQDSASSVRAYAEFVRTIAAGDPSVALVAAMHPAVLVFWMAEEMEQSDVSWTHQREQVFETARQGHWWGTMTSEPGSGGDIMKTRTVAVPMEAPGGFSLTGEKHFGSGSGQTSFMITTAKVEGDKHPDLFYMDMRGAPWDGTTGLKMMVEWDGMGMTATQSHAFTLKNFPAQRIASREALALSTQAAAGLGNMLFTAVILAIAETALSEAQAKLAPKSASQRSLERVEWTKAVNEIWLMRQAYEGTLAAIEQNRQGNIAAARAKACCAELAESALTRLSRVIGGSSFARGMPFAQWSQDVRALGFLRPPWALAYDQLYDMSWK